MPYLQKFRETAVLLLLALLPLHALLLTIGTKLIAGPGHAPLTLLVLWKEVLLSLILVIALLEIFRERRFVLPDLLDWLIIALLMLSLMVTYDTHQNLKLYLFGFKYDFIPLIAFIILRRVYWSSVFQERTLTLFLWIGGLLAGYGILSFFLPQAFFLWLGYSDLHSLYLPDAPLAAYQQLADTGIRRIQGTFSGPNQLGLWLIVPWSVVLLKIMRGNIYSFIRLCVYSTLLIVIAVALILTFSRAAWIAAAAILALVLWMKLPKRTFLRAGFWLLVSGFSLLVIMGITLPQVLVRTASTREHLARPMEAIKIILAHPYGLGMGTAGPASNRKSDACVYLPKGADASWAVDRQSLCVFVDNVQVQPPHPCNCPLLPENWYLQIGVELGVLGIALFTTLVLLILYCLFSTFHQSSSILYQTTFLLFLGVSIASLFLHAWEESAVAYSAWMLLAMSLSLRETTGSE